MRHLYTQPNYLDCDLHDTSSLHRTLIEYNKPLHIVQSLHCNLLNIEIEIIKIAIQIECLHVTTFLDSKHDLNDDPDDFAPSKRGK